MDQKQKEKEILSLVYAESDYADIEESESPDFLITHEGRVTCFGVEITEFYLTESHARMCNIPHYISDILDNNRFRHKDDYALQVDNINITTADGIPKQRTRVIIEDLPPPEAYSLSVADIITNKSTKFQDYVQGLNHVNLIIFDNECRLRQVPVDSFYRHFFTPSLVESLYSTEFREVIFVTALDETRRVYLPLKMMLLIADLYAFATLVKDYPWEPADETSPALTALDTATERFMVLFAKYMRAKSEYVRVLQDSEQIEVLLGNSGVILDSGHVAVHDHADYPLSAGTHEVPQDELTAFFAGAEFREKAKQLLEGKAFYAEIAYDVKGDLEF